MSHGTTDPTFAKSLRFDVKDLAIGSAHEAGNVIRCGGQGFGHLSALQGFSSEAFERTKESSLELLHIKWLSSPFQLCLDMILSRRSIHRLLHKYRPFTALFSPLLALLGPGYPAANPCLPTQSQPLPNMAQPPTTSRSSPIDILIIGAGPGGLSAATGIARLLHTTIVFSSNAFRNQLSQHMHGVPSWDHRDPSEFRAATKRDLLARYNTTSFVDVSIKTVKKLAREDGSSLFEAVDEEGKSWWGRKVILATGIKDVFPDIEGYEDCWVKGM